MDNSRPDRELTGHVRPAGWTRRGLGAMAWTSTLCPCPSVGRMDVHRPYRTLWTRVVDSRSHMESMGWVVDR